MVVAGMAADDVCTNLVLGRVISRIKGPICLSCNPGSTTLLPIMILYQTLQAWHRPAFFSHRRRRPVSALLEYSDKRVITLDFSVSKMSSQQNCEPQIRLCDGHHWPPLLRPGVANRRRQSYKEAEVRKREAERGPTIIPTLFTCTSWYAAYSSRLDAGPKYIKTCGILNIG